MDLFCYLCFVSFMLSCQSIAALRPPGLLALLYVIFSCVILTFPCVVLGQVWNLIVSIPDFCLLLNYVYIMSWHPSKIVYFFQKPSTKRRYSN